MAPTKTDTGHGALFDVFPQQLRSLHGGARFDEGFNLQPKAAPKGPTYDEFGQPMAPDQGGHGPVWDEWGWKDIPEMHGGTLYDEGFDSPAANETSRGPLYDLFEPSTQVKFIYDGQDAEGIVDHVRNDGIVMVTPRKGGNAIEVGLEQFLSYRSPSIDNATTTADRSQAEAPSAWSSDAHGAGRSAAPNPGRPVEPTPQGQATETRTEIPADWSIVDHVKSLLAGDDVAKAGNHHEFALHNSGYRMSRGPSRGSVDHWSNRSGRRIGASVEHTPGKVAAGYHYENGDHKTLDGPFHSHSEAHNAIVAHHEGLDEMSGRIRNHAVDTGQASTTDVSKTATSPLDVLKATLGVPEKHQLRVARQTVHMNPGIAGAMGGPSIHEAHDTIRRLTGRTEPHSFTPGRGAGGCDYCPHPSEHGVHNIGGRMANKTGPRLPSDVLKTRSEWSGVTTVAKDMTTAETAVQGQNNAAPFAGAVGSGSYCPECREKKGKLTDDGRCPDCNTVLRAHEDKVIKREKGDGNGSAESSDGKGVGEKTLRSVEDLRKAFGAGGDPVAGGQTVTSDGSRHQRGQQTGQATGDPPDVPVEEREHKESDHNSETEESHSAGATCPHCGQPLAELDRKTDEGAPAHKCLESMLDMLKETDAGVVGV